MTAGSENQCGRKDGGELRGLKVKGAIWLRGSTQGKHKKAEVWPVFFLSPKSHSDLS